MTRSDTCLSHRHGADFRLQEPSHCPAWNSAQEQLSEEPGRILISLSKSDFSLHSLLLVMGGNERQWPRVLCRAIMFDLCHCQ